MQPEVHIACRRRRGVEIDRQLDGAYVDIADVVVALGSAAIDRPGRLNEAAAAAEAEVGVPRVAHGAVGGTGGEVRGVSAKGEK